MSNCAECWTTVEINGKPAELFEPTDSARGTIIFLHNARCQSLSISEKYTQKLNESRLNCVCPWGGATWWSDRVVASFDPQQSSERYILESVAPFAHRRWNAQSLGLLGISMGGQGALRIAFKKPELFPVVAAIAPAIEYHEYYGQGTLLDEMYSSKEQCRQDTVPMHVHPSQPPPHVFFCCDPGDEHWHRGTDRLHEKLSALGVAHQCDLTTQAGGHSWAYFDAMSDQAIGFLSRGLAIEARRLL